MSNAYPVVNSLDTLHNNKKFFFVFLIWEKCFRKQIFPETNSIGFNVADI